MNYCRKFSGEVDALRMNSANINNRYTCGSEANTRQLYTPKTALFTKEKEELPWVGFKPMTLCSLDKRAKGQQPNNLLIRGK